MHRLVTNETDSSGIRDLRSFNHEKKRRLLLGNSFRVISNGNREPDCTGGAMVDTMSLARFLQLEKGGRKREGETPAELRIGSAGASPSRYKQGCSSPKSNANKGFRHVWHALRNEVRGSR